MWIYTFLWLLHKLNQQKIANFRKKSTYWQNTVLCGRSIHLWYTSHSWYTSHVVGPSICGILPILFVLTLASDRAVLYGHVAFSILTLSSKKQQSSFLKRFPVYKKFVSKLKYWKRSKFPVIITYKHADLSIGALF